MFKQWLPMTVARSVVCLVEDEQRALQGHQVLQDLMEGLPDIEANPEDAWTLTADADWFSVTQSFGSGDGSRGTGDAVIVVLSDRWTMNSIRTGTITVTGPTGAFTKTLTQNPKPVPEAPLQLKGSIPFSGSESRISLPEGYWVLCKLIISLRKFLTCDGIDLALKYCCLTL